MDIQFIEYTKRRINLCLNASFLFKEDNNYVVFYEITQNDVEQIKAKLLELFYFVNLQRQDWISRSGREIQIRLLETELLTPYFSKFALSRDRIVTENENEQWLVFEDNEQRLVGLVNNKLIFVANGISRQSELSVTTFLKKSGNDYESDSKLLEDAFEAVMLADASSPLYFMKTLLSWDR